jgi:ectoine hydrolase
MREVPGLHFPLEEYRTRLRRVHEAMERRGIDILVLSDPCNMYYACGYDAWSFYVPQVVIVSRDSDRLVWVGREMDAGGARLTTCLESEDVEAYGDRYVQAADAHPMSHVASVIRARGWAAARIGVELNSYYFGAGAYEVLKRELAQAKWIDASLLVNWVRVVKSPAELRYMHEAARIVENAMRAALEHARPGVRQCDVAAEIYRAQMRGTPEFGGQYTSTPPLMPSGERVDNPHLPWTSEPYVRDSLANFELVASRHRYHTPLARSLYFGKPPPATRTLEAAFLEGIDAVLTGLKPGITAEKVESLWQTAAGKYGVRKRARCGYSIGIAFPPTFGEQTISLRPGDQTVLQEGMTLHLMPAVWQDGASMVITEPLIVTATGCEPLCRFERKLFTQE